MIKEDWKLKLKTFLVYLLVMSFITMLILAASVSL